MIDALLDEGFLHSCQAAWVSIGVMFVLERRCLACRHSDNKHREGVLRWDGIGWHSVGDSLSVTSVIVSFIVG